MFILIPVGVDDHTVDRMPVISIGIAVACALAFLVTWVFPIGSDGEKEAREVMRRWVQQPVHLPREGNGRPARPAQAFAHAQAACPR